MEYKGKKKKIQVSLEKGSNINELYKICILIDNTNESDGKSMKYEVAPQGSTLYEWKRGLGLGQTFLLIKMVVPAVCTEKTPFNR